MTKSDESVDFNGETNPNLSLQNEFLNIFYIFPQKQDRSCSDPKDRNV